MTNSSFLTRARASSLLPWALCALFLVPVFSQGAEPGDLENGISAYRSGDYARALQFLEAAVEKNPRSAGAYYYLGLTTFALEDYEKSVAALKRSLSLDNRKTDAHLYLGMAYFHLELYEFSVQALDQAINEESGGPTAWFFRGLSYSKMGQSERARSDLKKSGELDPEFRRTPEYQRIVTDAGEDWTGSSEPSNRNKSGRGTRTAPARDRDLFFYGSESKPLDETASPWKLEVAGGLLFDDNVTSTDQDVTSNESDTAVVAEVSGRYVLPRWNDVEFTAGYDFYQSLYKDLSDFNLQSHVLSLDAFRAAGPLDAGLGYSYLASRIGGDALLNAHALTASLGQAVTRLWYPNVLFKLQARKFPDDSRRDGSQVTIGVDNFVFPPGINGHLLLGVRHVSEDADADYFDYQGNQVRVGFKQGFTLKAHEMKAGAEYAYVSRHYRDHDPSIGRKRKDHLNNVRLNLEVFFKKNLSGFMEYEYMDSDSNLPAADYRENLLNMMVRFSL